MNPEWITNSPTIAAALRAADDELTRAREAARGLSLAEKIEALRSAKAAHRKAYEAVEARL
jgi:hypothetical protein